jgi:hypothetical protein
MFFVRIIAFAKLLQQWLEVHPLRNQSTIIKDATAAFSHEGMHAVYEVNGPQFAQVIFI